MVIKKEEMKIRKLTFRLWFNHHALAFFVLYFPINFLPALSFHAFANRQWHGICLFCQEKEPRVVKLG